MVATAIEPVPSLNKEAVKLIERSRSNWLLSNEVYFLLRHHEEFRLVINCESPHLPTGGTLYLIDRQKCSRFRKDGHNWRKKKDGKSPRETHEKLKVGDSKRLYCTYVTAESLPLQRRCYSLLDCQELEHVVLVHYLEVHPGNTGRKRTDRKGATLSTDPAAQVATDTASAGGSGYSDSWGGSGSPLQSVTSDELAHIVSACDDSVQPPPDVSGPAAAGTRLLAQQAQRGMFSSPPGTSAGRMGGHVGRTKTSGRAGVGGAGGPLTGPPTPLRPAQQQQVPQSPVQPLTRFPRKRGSPDIDAQRCQQEEQTLKRAASGPLYGLSEQEVRHTLTTLSLDPANQTPDHSGLGADQVAPSSETPGQGARPTQEHPELLEDLNRIAQTLIEDLNAASRGLNSQGLPPFWDLGPRGSSVYAPGSLHLPLGELAGEVPGHGTVLLQPAAAARLSWHARGLNRPAGEVRQQQQRRQQHAHGLDRPAGEVRQQQQQWQQHAHGLDRPAGEVRQQQQQWQQRQRVEWEAAAAAEVPLQAQEYSGRHSLGGSDRGHGCSAAPGRQQLLGEMDTALDWLDPVLPTLGHADDGPVPELPFWEPDIPLDAPVEQVEQGLALGGAMEGGSTGGHLLLSAVAGVGVQKEIAESLPFILPQQWR